MAFVLWVHVDQICYEDFAKSLECLHLSLCTLGLMAKEQLIEIAIDFFDVFIFELFQFADITVFGSDESE